MNSPDPLPDPATVISRCAVTAGPGAPASARGAACRFTLMLLCLLAGSTAAQDYIGSERCAGCHQSAYKAWQGSHHDLAMQAPSESTVLGDFADASFEYNGITTRFSRRGEQFLVTTDGEDGKLTEFEVAWVFGVYPLQQYLLPLPGGRLQALSIAWDSRAAREGGQRWYHLYPDEQIGHDDPLHWTGPYQNWNTRCAECHSTDVHKGYDATDRTFSTRFAEVNVGCEACHGPGGRHLELAQTGMVGNTPGGGFAADLGQRGRWAFPDGEAIARRRQTLENQIQIDSCGRCHARRGTLGEYQHGRPLADTHRLSLLGSPLYEHDGQILDEVYVYGSFVQSKMHRAGVVCSNCHEPHSNALRAEGNGVCAQCHKAETYDTPQHYRHEAGGAAAQCVSCHMPDRVYMGVDARRDHSMRIPRPDLSVMIGTPNACNQCHADKTPDWSLQALRRWDMAPTDTAAHPALAMEALDRGDTRAVPRLLELASDPGEAAIWRATALERSAGAGSREALQLAAGMLLSDDPQLRVSAVRALASLPPAQRFPALFPLLSDPVSGVRMELAMALAPTPLAQLSESQRSALLGAFQEYLAVQRQHADMPSIQMQLGLFSLGRGDYPAAEAAYREAIALNPQLIAARLNLADLLRQQQREEEARGQLEAAVAVAPDSGAAAHALGLLEARSGNREEALRWLGQAAELAAGAGRHRFVYAVALHDFGDAGAALRVLERLHRELPADEQVLLALSNYSQELGLGDRALSYAEKLVALDPQNPQYRRLAATLRSRRG